MNSNVTPLFELSSYMHFVIPLIKKAMKFIDDNLSSQKDWKLFEANFNKVHENFFKNLKAEYPTLTQNELRLCAYLSMNKTSKEIASLMNISIRGVES